MLQGFQIPAESPTGTGEPQGERGRSCPTSGTGKAKSAPAQPQLNFPTGYQLTAEHDFKFLQDVKSHTKTQRFAP